MDGEGEIVLRPKLALGRMGDQLLEVAEAEDVDLIVTGNHRRRGPARLASVLNVALHFSRASVALVATIDKALDLAAPEGLPSIRRVLVATDLSAFSNRAIAHAYQLVAAAGGDVTLLHVISDDGALSTSDAGIVTLLRSQIPESAPRNNIVTRTEVVRSPNAARALCEASDRLQADVVCLASHGRSGVKRALLGSVAEGVLRLGHRPLFHRPTASVVDTKASTGNASLREAGPRMTYDAVTRSGCGWPGCPPRLWRPHESPGHADGGARLRPTSARGNRQRLVGALCRGLAKPP